MTTEEFHRKLTAILSADVQGYSRLMGEEEESTVRTLTAYRTLMSSLIRDHRGHVVDTPGDNLLAKFDSGTDAVRCAVEIQEELRIRNADFPENRKMQFRIGINLGDVIEEGDRIYGDGINVAARIEGLAEGGGICISGFVYGAIKNKLSLSYDFIGEHSVKNIKDPVRVYRIRMEPDAAALKVKEKASKVRTWQRVAIPVVVIFILGIVAIWYLSFRQAETPITIAVLPFADLSPEKDQEYFVDGLSEELLNFLAKIQGLSVTSRTSAFSFKDKDKTVQEIASVLGVRHILEGSVRKAGNTIRVTAQLIRTSDDRHLWSNQYDRVLKNTEDILSIQGDIAKAVANELKLTLGVGESLKQLGGTDNVEAYELYLIANGQFRDVAPERALVSINQALAIDPDFALAWALKSQIHQGLSPRVPNNRIATELTEGLQAAHRAILLEPDMAAGYHSLGTIKSVMGEWIEAELALIKARELITDPSLRYEIDYPLHYIYVGKLERAREIFEGLLQNDPLNENFRSLYIECLGLLGDRLRAEEEYKRGMELFGNPWSFALGQITITRIGSGDILAKDEIVDTLRIDDVAKKHLDSPEDGLAELRQIYDNDNNLDIWAIARISLWAAYFGDLEFSMDSMEKSGSIAVYGVAQNLLWFPVMHEVRQLPQFKEFVREIGLVDFWERFGWPDLCHPIDDGAFVCD